MTPTERQTANELLNELSSRKHYLQEHGMPPRLGLFARKREHHFRDWKLMRIGRDLERIDRQMDEINSALAADSDDIETTVDVAVEA